MSDAAPSEVVTRKDLEAKIIARAWTDEDFRLKFLADPKAQFEEHLGTKLPESLVISAHQEDANSLHFVIPVKPQVDLDELSDEDLERVAGGIGVIAITALGASALIVGTIALTASLAATATVASAVASASLGGWGVKK